VAALSPEGPAQARSAARSCTTRLLLLAGNLIADR
jgi:hypothetical protein